MVCFLGTPTAKEEKAELRELNATVPDVPQYLDWSEAPITWDREDHPEHVPHPSKYALVIDLIVDNFRLTKVLMDGGSSRNILYEDTLKRMNLAHNQLDYSKVTFHDIVPGREAKSMGSIKLDVTFRRRQTIAWSLSGLKLSRSKVLIMLSLDAPPFPSSWQGLVTFTAN